MDHSPTLDKLALQLADVRAGAVDAVALVDALRGEAALLAALGPRFGAALEEIATRLESVNLFSEESCSFSRRDLIDALAQWIEHARTRLNQVARAA